MNYGAFLRSLECVTTGALGPLEAAHIRSPNDESFQKPLAGVSAKPHDRWMVPLSVAEHRHQHHVGEAIFWSGHGMPLDCESRSPMALAGILWGLFNTQRHNELLIHNARVEIGRFRQSCKVRAEQ